MAHNPPKSAPPSSWFNHLRELANSKNRVNWDIGDALVQGELVYKITYRAANEATGIDPRELRDIASVARRVQLSVRTDKLSWSHHREVAALDASEQVRWLAAAGAKEPPMTLRKLRDAIRQERRDRQRVVAISKGGAKGCGGKLGPYPCCSVVCGDTFGLLPKLPTGAVGAVITDPPYGVSVDEYGGFVHRAKDSEWDGAVPYDLLPEFLRVASGGVLWFGSATKIAEAYARFDEAPHRQLIWAPSFKLGHFSAQGIAYRFQPIYTWRLPKKHDGPVWDVLDTPTERGNWWKHDCTKPLELMRALVGFAPSGATVIDPFAGSGTTLVAAQATGRHFLGFEKDAKYVAVANARLSGEVPRDGEAIEKAAA